jgi:hypothetical protein
MVSDNRLHRFLSTNGGRWPLPDHSAVVTSCSRMGSHHRGTAHRGAHPEGEQVLLCRPPFGHTNAEPSTGPSSSTTSFESVGYNGDLGFREGLQERTRRIPLSSAKRCHATSPYACKPLETLPQEEQDAQSNVNDGSWRSVEMVRRRRLILVPDDAGLFARPRRIS